MTAVQEPVDVAHAAHFQYAKPATDAAALRDIDHELRHLHEKAEQIKQAPEQFHPKLVLSEHVRGSSVLCPYGSQRGASKDRWKRRVPVLSHLNLPC